jgi:hypothetical protein
MKKLTAPSKKLFRNLRDKPKVSKSRVLVVILAFAVVGSIFLFLTHAATPTANLEAENGTVTAPAIKGSDANASGSSYVQFQAAQAGGGTCNNRQNPTGKPDASTTGVPPGTTLTVYNGDLTITTAGAVVSGMDVHGFVYIDANNVTFQCSVVRGRTGAPRGTLTANGGLIDAGNSHMGTVIRDVEVDNQFPNVAMDGIWGDNIMVQRSNIHGTVDGMKPATGSTISYNYIHDNTWFANDPNQGGTQTHNDGVQVLRGANITINNNNLYQVNSLFNSAIQITQDFGTVSNLNIRNNWADGGHCTFNFAQKGGGALTINLNGNRFGHNSGFAGCAVKLSGVTLVGSGNVYDDTGQAIVPQ